MAVNTRFEELNARSRPVDDESNRLAHLKSSDWLSNASEALLAFILNSTIPLRKSWEKTPPTADIEIAAE
jgi:hypothetical protein